MVVCQVHGRPDPTSRGHASSWWLYAQGGTPNRPNRYGYGQRWAFLPANVLAQGSADRAVPGVPTCRLDLGIPGMPDVTSFDYSGDGDWYGSAATMSRFRFSPVTGTSDLGEFIYDFDSNTPATFVAATGPIYVHLAPPGSGLHTLSWRTQHWAGNLSPIRPGSFEVGPRPADPTQGLAAPGAGVAAGEAWPG